MSRLSIVIPVVGRTAAFEAGLVSVLTERPAECEILAVLNGPYDDPYELDDEVRYVQAPSGANWVESVNRGVLAAKSPFVHILDAGANVANDWAEAPIAALSAPKCSAVAVAVKTPGQRHEFAGQVVSQGRVQRIRPHRLKRTRSRLPLAPLPAGGFYRREDLLTLCGLSEQLSPDLAIAELVLRLREAGGQTVFAAESKITCAELPPSSAFSRGVAEERFFLAQLEDVKLATMAIRAAKGLPSLLMGKLGPLSGMAKLAGRTRAWFGLAGIREQRDQQLRLVAELAAQIEDREEQSQAPLSTRWQRAA